MKIGQVPAQFWNGMKKASGGTLRQLIIFNGGPLGNPDQNNIQAQKYILLEPF
jgi:hypothetical protein